MMINKMRRSKGFTLVELLLVVAILAVLAFLAVPAIAQTIQNSRIRTCASNEGIIETNLWRWYADAVAAGTTFTITADTVDLDAVLGQFDNISPADSLPDPSTYFTPSRYPVCPFNATNIYEVTLEVSDDGTSLTSLEVNCNGDHPKAPDNTAPTT